MKTTFPCTLCDGREVDLRFSSFPSWANHLAVGRCRGCGLLRAHPFPPPAALLERYTDAYFQCATPIAGGYENYIQDEPLIKKTFYRRLSLLPPSMRRGEGRRVLDVGCATGVFLEVMRNCGWVAEGIEVSPFAAEQARAKGFTVKEGTLEDHSLPSDHYDMVTLWDVIEHMADPVGSLRLCQRLLKPGGLLVVTTPDAGSPVARILGRRWLGFRSLGEHVYFFSRKTLARCAERSGFRVLRTVAVGKHLSLPRLLTRLSYYSRIFRWMGVLAEWLHSDVAFYVNSGDTFCLSAQKGK